MSKVLFLIRHAKSDWSISGQDDFERKLNSRGLQDAPIMGKHLKSLHVSPDIIISSPAERAKITAEFIAEQLDYSLEKIEFEEEIYEASPRTLLRLINNLDNKLDYVAMVGHNPTFTYIAEYLTKNEIGNMPTCSVVKINFEIDEWAEVSEGLGELIWFEYPKKNK